MSSAVKAVTKVFNIVAKPLQKLFGALMPKPPNPGATSSGNELKQIIRSSKEPARYVFGRTGTGALLAWAQEEPGEQDEAEKLHLVYVLTEGGIHAMDEIYVDQESINSPAAAELIEYDIQSAPTAPNAYMLEHSPDWRDSQIGRSLTWVRVTLKYDPEYFASGIPDLLFEYRACNDIYDPRTETSGYSDNAALVILWYVRHRLRVPDEEILWDTFIDAANVCDEVITNPDGSTERRYTVSGGFKADERKDRVLADLEAACAGSLIRVGGRFGLQVGAYYGPYELTIGEDMVIGTVTGQTEVSRADAVNTMRGKFVSPQQRWTETDYPAVSVAEWITEDGEEIEDTLDLRFVSSPYQAQRLANIALRRKRAGGTLELPLNFRGYACRPGRVVQVTLPTLNINGEFRVVDWDFSGDNGCKVTLQQEQPEIYDDAVGQPFDPFGFIQLPTGGIGSPTGLQYVLQSIGEVIQGRLVWNPVDAAMHYNVVIKRDGVAVQSAQVPSGVERCDVGGLEVASYTAEVRARGRLGQSAPAVISFNINVPPMPESVGVSAANDSITLTPRLSGDHGRVEFEFRWHPTPLPLNQVAASAEYLSVGASYTHTGLTWGTDYHYYVRSINAYGASPWLYVSAATTEDVEQILQGLTGQIRETELDQALQERIDKIDGPETLDGSVAQRLSEEAQARAEGLAEEAAARAQALAEEAQARIDGLEGAGAALEEERLIRESEDDYLAALNRILVAAKGVNAASYQYTVETRTTEWEAQTVVNESLVTQINDNVAAIESESLVRATENEALASQIDSLAVQVGEDNTAAIESEATTRASEDEALATRIDSVVATSNGNTAAIQSEATTRASEDEALALIVDSLIVEVGESNTAAIQSEATARASEDEALASRIDSVVATSNDNTAAIQSEATARATEDEALATRIDSVVATSNDNTAAIQSEATARASADQAMATLIESIVVEAGDTNSAAINYEAYVRASEDEALATRIDSVVATSNGNTAAIQSEATTRASEDEALASLISTVQAEFDDELASVQQSTQVQYNQTTQRLQAMWTLRIDNGGRVSGFGLSDDGVESLLGFRADRIFFAHPNSTDEVFPMVLDGGRVVMNDALINKLLFTKLRSSDGSLVFANGKLQASYIAVDDLVVRQGQSSNYQPGAAGWRLTTTGGEINFPISFNSVQGGPPADADKTSSNVAYDTARVAGNDASELANAALYARDQADAWTRPSSTLIDGNKIFTGDAYVDTLQIKGQAVTIPASAFAGGKVALGQYSEGTWAEAASIGFNAEGAPVQVIFSAQSSFITAVNGSARGWIRLLRGGVVLETRMIFSQAASQANNGPATVVFLAGAHNGYATYSVQFRYTDETAIELSFSDRYLGLIAVKR